MSQPASVTCPKCSTQLDLTGVAQIPPTVRCGKCSYVFATNDKSEGTKSRWKGDVSASSGGLLPPSSFPAPQTNIPSTTPASPVAPSKQPVQMPAVTTSPSAPGTTDALLPPGSAPQVSTPQQPKPNTANSSAVPIFEDEDEPSYKRRGRGFGISSVWLVAGGTGLIVIAATVFAAMYLSGFSFQFAMNDDDANETNNESVERLPQDIRWTDAARFSAKIGTVKVKVSRVEFGEIRARNEQRELQTSQDDSFFQVYLEVTNQGLTDVDYKSWYGNQFDVSEQKVVARLVDAEETSFPMLVFRDALEIHGHTPTAILRRGVDVRDTLLFEIPADVDIRSVEFFRLVLPAAAFGQSGTLYFQIPAEMVEPAMQSGSLLDDEDQQGGLLDGQD